MSINYMPRAKINDCTACAGTGEVYWLYGEEYDAATCDWCKGEVTKEVSK